MDIHARKSVPTGIDGLDSILGGGYPLGSPTLLRGSSGSGKTKFAFAFAEACIKRREHVVYATFDESPEILRESNKALFKKTAISFLDFRIDPSLNFVEGSFEMGGLLARIELALNKYKTKNLVLDSFDNLFFSFENKAQIRIDLLALLKWCRDRNVTLVAAAGESADYMEGTGLIDYACDCSIRLQQVPKSDLMTRKLHVVKYRRRAHGTNYYPFVIEADGISVMPITNTSMAVKVSNKYLSTGLSDLDKLLDGKGVYQGSTIMYSGESGTGKSLLAMTMAGYNAQMGVNILYVCFEEPANQIVRNARSIGMNLNPVLKSNHLDILSVRPVEQGLEEHIISILKKAELKKPQLIVLDPITALLEIATTPKEFKSMVLRLLHILKERGHTVLLTELIPDSAGGYSKLNISSLTDTWVKLTRGNLTDGSYRAIQLNKSRGIASDMNIRYFNISKKGFKFKQ